MNINIKEEYDVYQLVNGTYIEIPKPSENRRLEQYHNYDKFIDVLVEMILKYSNEIKEFKPTMKKAS